MKDPDRGVYVRGFLDGNSNTTTENTAVGVVGYLFENGECLQSVAEMTMAWNHLELSNKLVEAANDPWKYGSWRVPSLVFEDVMASGV